jgi:hypothetical protein
MAFFVVYQQGQAAARVEGVGGGDGAAVSMGDGLQAAATAVIHHLGLQLEAAAVVGFHLHKLTALVVSVLVGPFCGGHFSPASLRFFRTLNYDSTEKTQRNRGAEKISLWYLCFSAPLR